MNILLSKMDLDLEDFYTIGSYEKFSSLTDEDLHMVHQIRIDDFDLGINCIFDLVNRPRGIFNRTSFILNILDPLELCQVQYFIRKYKRVAQKEIELRAANKYKYVYERNDIDE